MVKKSIESLVRKGHGDAVWEEIKARAGVWAPSFISNEPYPDFQKDVSHAVLVFNTAAGDTNGDGYYTVKIDNWEGSNDLDAELGGILAYLIENDANIDAGTELLGAQLKGGKVGVADGSYDDFWAADGSADTTIVEWTGKNGSTITEVASTDAEPAGLDVDQDSQTNVDQTYLYADLLA